MGSLIQLYVYVKVSICELLIRNTHISKDSFNKYILCTYHRLKDTSKMRSRQRITI